MAVRVPTAWGGGPDAPGRHLRRYIADLSEVFVTEAAHIYDVIRKGASNRSVAATKYVCVH